MSKLIIIGTGLAGYTLAREIRKRDSESELLLITRDDGSSYSKPMLSNALGKNKHPDALVMSSAEQMAETLAAEIWTRTRVNRIDTRSQTLHTEKGMASYTKLVLANGANTIMAPIKGNAANKILSVNDLDDYRLFRAELEKGRRVVIIGAGLIGCEFANDLSTVGADISVVDLASRPLGSLLPEKAASLLQEKLSELGINWHLNNAVNSVETSDDGLRVTLKDSTVITADIVLSAIGLRPNLELATEAGIETDRGLKVDRFMQTSHENIYGLGDCAQIEDLTLPFVMPLMNSARALAATLCGEDTAVSYPAMPVVVKTPCYPVVVCPTPRPKEGHWEEEITDEGVRALFRDNDGNLAGFALTGELVREKMALSKQVDDWLA